MIRHAVVNKDYKVVNVILWDRVSQWQPPINHLAIQCFNDLCNIGDIYDPNSKKFYRDQLALPSDLKE